MASYLIKKDEKTNQIIYMEYELVGYEFKPRLHNNSYIKINNVTIIKPSLIEKTLVLKLKKKFANILYKIKIILDSDEASDGDVILCLDELKRLAGILLHKYDKFLKKSVEQEYLRQIMYLEKELQKKLLFANMKQKEEEIVEEKSRGR